MSELEQRVKAMRTSLAIREPADYIKLGRLLSDLWRELAEARALLKSAIPYMDRADGSPIYGNYCEVMAYNDCGEWLTKARAAIDNATKGE
jgi:hypothetical protein